jgi:hypothetical protein
MDQCCAFGSRVVAMTFDGDLMDTKPLVVTAPLNLVRGGQPTCTPADTGILALMFPCAVHAHPGLVLLLVWLLADCCALSLPEALWGE